MFLNVRRVGRVVFGKIVSSPVSITIADIRVGDFVI